MRNLVSLIRTRARRRGRVVIAAALASCVAVVGVASAADRRVQPVRQPEGRRIPMPKGSCCPPTNGSRRSGTRILDYNARLVSSTISPNGHYLAALGWNDFSGFLTIIDLQTDKIVSQTALDSGTGSAEDNSVGPDGPLFSSDGKHPLGPAVDVARQVQLRSRRPARPTQTGPDCAVRFASHLVRVAIRTSARATRAVPTCRREWRCRPTATRCMSRSTATTRSARSTPQTDTLSKTDPGRQRAAPGGPRRQRHGRLRLQRGRPPGEQRSSSRTCQTARRSSRAGRPAAAITGTVSVVNLDDRQGGAGDSGRPPADGSLPERQRAVRRQLQ